MVDRKAEHIASLDELNDETEALKEEIRETMVREMSLDNSHAEFPSNLAREWSIAQAHLVNNEVMLEDEEPVVDEVQMEIAEEAYSKVMGKLDSRTSTVDRQMGNDLLEDLLLEKSLDLDKFKGAKPVTREQLSLRQVSD